MLLARAGSWAWPGVPPRGPRLAPLYSCEQLCGRCDGKPGDPKVRAAMRCSLPDFDPASWDPTADPEAAAEAERFAGDLVGSAANQGNDLDLDLDRDGCPWGWALSRFASTVRQYVGRRSLDDPRRSLSLRMEWILRRADERPDRVIEAVEHLENHEDGALALFARMK